MNYKIILKDGNERQVAEGTTAYNFAGELSRSLQKSALVAKWNGQFLDMASEIPRDGTIEFFNFESPEGKEALRHTSSHIMAQAIQRLYPDVKFGIGPAIENGFYYDMDSAHIFTPDDLDKIQVEMEKIIKEDIPMKKKICSRQEAINFFQEKGELYKVELINDLPEDVAISLYEQGDFVDLCAGPHVMSTGKVKAIKLLNIAGAYWRGSEKNKMLQRIYGTAFEKKEQLEEYLHLLEEAARRDHRRMCDGLDRARHRPAHGLVRHRGRDPPARVRPRGSRRRGAHPRVPHPRTGPPDRGRRRALHRVYFAMTILHAGHCQSPGRPAAIHLSVSARPSRYLAQL